MTLTQFLTKNDIPLTVHQLQSFMTGALLGKKPLSSGQIIEEIMMDAVHLDQEIEELVIKEFEKLILIEWENIKKTPQPDKLFSSSLTLEEITKGLDYFLMGLALSGFVADEESEKEEILENLEDWLLEVDEWIAEKDEVEDTQETQALKDGFFELWKDLFQVWKI